MAASKDLTKSTSEGSEEMFDICCSSCNEQGKTTEAKKFCVDCGLYFCENCLGFHKIIPSLQSHQIVDSEGEQTQGKGEKAELPTERCSTHHGKLMDMFCGDHDEVCCGACIAIKHRACINVDYVPNVAKGIRMSNEYKDVKGSITEVLNNMKQEKTRRTINLTSLEKEKIKVLQEVDEYQEEIVLKIKELAESSRQDIRSKYEKIKKVITADVDTLDTLISTTDTNLQKLSITNEVQLFVNVKASKMAVKDGDSVLREMSSSWTNKHLKYARDEKLIDRISSMVSFGNLEDEEDVKEYKATLYGKFNVKQNTDTQTPFAITGICLLQDGSILLADHNNRKLKRLDSSYRIKESVPLDGNPIGICSVGKKEVAVCLYSGGKIQFVSVENNLKLTSTISVDTTCHGISYSETIDEMYACCGASIKVYNRAGSLLRTYHKGINGEQLFSNTRQVTVNAADSQIIVTDWNKGLVALDFRGTNEWLLSDQELIGAWGLCILPNGILAGGTSLNNVLQVDKTGRKMGVLLGVKEGFKQPYSLAFGKHDSRLIVGCNCEEIFVYTLSRK